MKQKCLKKCKLATFKDECKNLILYIFKVINLKAKELFFIIAERQSTQILRSGSPTNMHFWNSGTCTASVFYPLILLHEEVKSKYRQPEWSTNLQTRFDFMDLCYIWQAIQFVSHWRSEHSLGPEGGEMGWKNAKLNFNASNVASSKLKNTALLTLSTLILSQVINYLILRYPKVAKIHICTKFSFVYKCCRFM